MIEKWREQEILAIYNFQKENKILKRKWGKKKSKKGKERKKEKRKSRTLSFSHLYLIFMCQSRL